MADLGKVMITTKGNYSNITAYEKLDVVYFNGSSWLSKQSTTGNEPPTNGSIENDYWILMAQGYTEDDPNTILDFSVLPDYCNAEVAWSGQSFIQDNIVKHNNYQYYIVVNTSKNPVVCKRDINTGVTTTFDLSTVSGNPLSAPTADDLHNVYSLAVDSDGYIHVSGNHHGNALRYIRSNNPETISAWTTIGMVGTEENAVTYPAFLKLPNGKLLFFYRNGASGNGNTYVNTYNTSTQTWARTAFLFDGITSGESAYLNHIGVDWSTGTIHIMLVWRGTGNANTNNDICYVKSSDEGITWKKYDGTTYTLPITHSTVEVVVDTDATGSGLVNQCGFEVGTDGVPHGAFWLYDTNGYTQMHHVYHNDTEWVNEQVTNWTYRLETNVGVLGGQLSRPSVVVTTDNRVFFVYRNSIENKGSIRMMEVTPGNKRVDFPILNLDLYDYEFTFDTECMKKDNILSAIISPCNSYSTSTPTYYNANNWNKQINGLLNINMSSINDLIKQKVKLPCMKLMTGSNFTAAENTTSTTFAAMSSPLVANYNNGIIYNDSFKGKRLFYRLTARANQVSGTGFVIGIAEVIAGTAAQLLPFSETGNALKSTPWIPLKSTPDNTSFFLLLYGIVAASSEGRVTLSNIELAYLDY